MTQFEYTVNWEEAPDPKGNILWTAVFVIALAGLAYLTYMLTGDGFGTDGAARVQSYVDLTRGNDDFLVQNFAAIYPIIPFLLGLLFSNMPQIADAAPYYVDVFAAATLLGAGFYRLTRAGAGFMFALIFIVALAANPIFLFVATAGSGIAVALLFVYLFAIGTVELSKTGSVRGLIMISMAYAGLLLTTHLGVYFLVISLPLLAVLSRRQFVAQAPISFFIVLGFVPVAIVASLIFMNWVFVGDIPGLLRALTGGVTTAQAEMGLEPWPFLMGARPIGVIGVMVAGFFFATPMAAMGLTGFFGGSVMARTALLMGLALILTGVVTTYLGVLSHPAYLWVFAVPLSLVVLEEMAGGIMGRVLATLALLGGIAGGWWLLGLHPTGDLNFWRAEIGATVEQVTGIDLDLPQAVATAHRQDAALEQIEAETISVWGAREDILRNAGGE